MKIKKGLQKKVSVEELLTSVGNICFDFVEWSGGWLRYEFKGTYHTYVIRVETSSKVGCLTDSKRYLNSFSKDTLVVVKDSEKDSEFQKNVYFLVLIFGILLTIAFIAWVTVTYLTLLSFGIIMAIMLWFTIKSFNESSISIIYTAPVIFIFLIACALFKYGGTANMSNILSLFLQ